MPYKILLVDDDKEFREEFSELFDEYEIKQAGNGAEALNILKRPNDIDLVILDQMMPGQKGTDLIHGIRSLSPKIAIIILTGFSSKDVAVAALRSRADEYIEKPINIDKTRAVIEKLIETRIERFDCVNSSVESKIERVKSFLKRNYNKMVSLDDAAATICVSPKYLSRMFKRSVGFGFGEFKNMIKIKKACEIMASSDKNVGQISEMLGYQNPESFIRLFEKSKRCSPTKYRKAQKKAKVSQAAKKYESRGSSAHAV